MHTLQLDDQPEAVPRARQFVRETLRGTPLEHRSADSELILTELVTNATLHGSPPIMVGVDVSTETARFEVSDSSPGTPVGLVQNPEAMTGRGLMLVEALSDRWGVDRQRGGKRVWAEVGLADTEPEHDPAVKMAVSPDVAGDHDGFAPPSDVPEYTIELGDVPTDLLVSAKAHVDSIVREFALVLSGAASGQTAAVTADMARLIDAVTSRFAQARESIKRQAIAAAAAGEGRTRLVLTLPLSAADAGRDYLAALDEVDAYARAARLLTLETPPQHRAFRQWYVNSLVDQLRALARGEEPPRAPAFEQFLLDELEIVAMAHRATDRSARLQHVTGSLAAAISSEEVAKVGVAQGVEAVEASGGALLVPGERGRLEVLGHIHYSDKLLDRLCEIGIAEHLPAANALRSGEAVWIESPEQRDLWFPELRTIEPDTVSLCAIPLTLAGRTLGVLRLSFASPHLFDDEERAFVLAFSAQIGQALERAELYGSERLARAAAETAVGRLRRLNQVTAALAAASDVQQISAIVAEEAGRTLDATISALCLMEDEETLRTVQLQGTQPEAHERWQTFPVSAELPASEAVRENKVVVVHTRAELEHRYPALVGQAPQDNALVCVPLSVAGHPLGALSLSFARSYVVDDDAVDLLEAIGRQCALALERANLVSAERQARQRSGFLADSTARVASSLDPEETMENLCDLIVPELADWSAVYLADEVGRVVTATAKHRDPALTLAMCSLLKQNTVDLAAAGELGEVMLGGRRLRYAEMTHQQHKQVFALFGGAPIEELRADSLLAVPFIRQERVLGLLVMARTDSTYADSELMLATELADRAAVALDNATRFLRERDVAVTLQRSLLPQVLPKVPGLALAWRYFPGATGTNVGGDWYDVIPLERGRVALIIGDVMGRGLRAAAVMGQLRATARAHFYADLSPADVLARVDTELMRLEQEQIATALLAILDPATGGLTVASAGHLPPLVRTDEGKVEFLDVEPGPPLGTGAGGYTDLEVTLTDGATVLLYTDGLVEDRRLPIDDGLATLAAAATVSREPELLCDRALVALGRDTEHDDDTAMLAVHFGGRTSDRVIVKMP
jgi:GAF domain-containing protein/anti-sigma regulatory factor (Ser/Thr protein kinase)